MKRVLVTGRSGQVVSALREHGGAPWADIMAMGRPELDLLKLEAIADAIRAAQPNVIVSAAAYTAVDRAESEVEAAFAVNAEAAGRIAEVAAELGVPLIHISTDYVFDGNKAATYVEDDATNPLNVYGQSKLVGEMAVRAAHDNHAILRTGWVYSPFGSNFLKTMLRLATERPVLRVVDDQIGTPTSALDMAPAILAVARNLLERPDDGALRGTFHLTASGQASWADFADCIFAVSRERGGVGADVQRIASRDYPTPARRPVNSRLDTAKIEAVHGVQLTDWRVGAANVVQRVLATDA